jgi:hypothetical protein
MNNDDYILYLVRRYEKYQRIGSKKTVIFLYFLS